LLSYSHLQGGHERSKKKGQHSRSSSSKKKAEITRTITISHAAIQKTSPMLDFTSPPLAVDLDKARFRRLGLCVYRG
jgi:hypothetical protein